MRGIPPPEETPPFSAVSQEDTFGPVAQVCFVSVKATPALHVTSDREYSQLAKMRFSLFFKINFEPLHSMPDFV